MLEINKISNAIAIPIREISAHSIINGIFEENGSFSKVTKHHRSNDCIFHTGNTLEASSLNDLEILPNGIYGGIFFNHFGHFLIESIGRLWALNDPKFIKLPIYIFTLYGEIDFSDNTNFIGDILNILNIDISRIRVIKEPSRISTLYVPQSAYDFSLIGSPHPDFLNFIRKTTHQLNDSAASRTKKNIYVSRSMFDPVRGSVAGENVFESYLQKENYEIIYPEKLTFKEQVITYLSANKIIFCEGSAIHALIFTPDITAKIAVIMRRNDGGSAEIVHGQFIGIKKPVNWFDNIIERHTFGLPDWNGITVIDFLETSKELKKCGFVSNLLKITKLEEDKYREQAISSYLKAIKDYPDHISFLANQKEAANLNTPSSENALKKTKKHFEKSLEDWDEPPLTDEQVEAILEAEGHLSPLDKVEFKPFTAVITEPSNGRFKLVGAILTAILALVIIWQSISPLFGK